MDSQTKSKGVPSLSHYLYRRNTKRRQKDDPRSLNRTKGLDSFDLNHIRSAKSEMSAKQVG